MDEERLMKAALTFVYLIPSIVCAVAGAWLCYSEVDEWGWFLLASLLLYTVPSWRNSD